MSMKPYGRLSKGEPAMQLMTDDDHSQYAAECHLANIAETAARLRRRGLDLSGLDPILKALRDTLNDVENRIDRGEI